MSNIRKLPTAWRLVKCEEIIDVRDGTHDTPQKVKAGIPIITSKNLKPEGIDFSSATSISELDHQQIEKRSRVDDGDILFAMIGTIGNPTIVKKDRDFSIKNIALFKLEGTQVISEYFRYLLSTPFLKHQIDSATRGGTQKFVSLSVLRSLQIPLPPIATQKHIAAILDQAEELRSKRRSAIALLDELGRSVFLEMFGDPFRLTKQFIGIKLGDLAEWHSGGTPSRTRKDYFIGNIPWFSSGELENTYISRSKENISDLALSETSAKSVKKGSLMLGMYDTAALKASISDVDCSCNQAIAFAILNPKIVETIYVYSAIVIGREDFRRLQRGVRQKNLNLDLIRRIQIPKPPLELQQQFAKRMEAIETLKATHRQSLAKLDSLFNSLQSAAFNGELGIENEEF